ncbi:hypothetical protein [Bacteroides eggerthii]|uniref:hypothetical protein n=1 Tax=Bacteroides eggerthii TaxID=28111 RepID=UPI0022E2A62F|nr:hypothetical protein [Bacteroides eggerthii]
MIQLKGVSRYEIPLILRFFNDSMRGISYLAHSLLPGYDGKLFLFRHLMHLIG